MRQIHWPILNSACFTKVVCRYAFVALIIHLPAFAIAEVIDPESYIQKNGYQSQHIGDDGKTPFYTFTERTKIARIASLKREIGTLPKNEEVLKYCEFMRDTTKATLIESSSKAIDVAVSNYGHKGAMVACVLKYMYDGKVGTQLIYTKKARNAMFMVFVTN